MPDTKISALTALTAPAAEDLLPIVDDPSGTPLSRKVTVGALLAIHTDAGDPHPGYLTTAEGDAAYEVAGAVAAHAADAADAHDASAVSLLDAADLFAATDVEAALAESGPAPLDLWIGPVDPRMLTAASVIGANSGHYFGFQVHRAVTVSKIRLQVNTQSGNIDVGLYSIAGLNVTRLSSSGSVACPVAGQAAIALTGPVALRPGVKYMVAISADNGVVKVLARETFTPGETIQGAYLLAMSLAAQFPLPATAAFISWSVTQKTFGLYPE